MEEVLTDQYLEKINGYLGKMKSVGNVKEDPLMEWLHPLFKEYHGLENEEAKFHLPEEEAYPSLCALRDTNHLKNDEEKMNLPPWFMMNHK